MGRDDMGRDDMVEADGSGERERLLGALGPVLDAVGASIVDAGDASRGDVEVVWNDRVVVAVRLPSLHRSMERLIDQVELELGGRLSTLTREQKQQAVARLDDLGAFTLRGAVEDLAAVIGVSRITIYSYLHQRYR